MFYCDFMCEFVRPDSNFRHRIGEFLQWLNSNFEKNRNFSLWAYPILGLNHAGNEYQSRYLPWRSRIYRIMSEMVTGSGTEIFSHIVSGKSNRIRLVPVRRLASGFWTEIDGFVPGVSEPFPAGYGRKKRKNPVNSGPEYCFHKITVNPRNRPFTCRTVRPGNWIEYI
jgi:hypothetical protein